MNHLSACLVTFNEAHNLPRVLNSIRSVADEIVVVDCGSQDRTQEIARRYGATVITHEWTNFADQKNLAAEHASHDWILSLDADEELSPDLQKALLEWKSKPPDCGVYEFARLTWYLGAWVRHTRWYPDFQRKLYRRDQTKFQVKYHAAPQTEGRVGRISGDLLHYTVRSFEEHEAKVEKMTTTLAQDMFVEGRRSWRAAMWLAAPWNWFNNYVVCLGFLDGSRGWLISRMAARGTWLKFKKLGRLIEAERRAGKKKML